MSKSGIYIKPSKRGSFTKWCKNQGYGGVTSECIRKGKNSKSSAIRKKATFAANARKWNKQLGGYLMQSGGPIEDILETQYSTYVDELGFDPNNPDTYDVIDTPEALGTITSQLGRTNPDLRSSVIKAYNKSNLTGADYRYDPDASSLRRISPKAEYRDIPRKHYYDQLYGQGRIPDKTRFLDFVDMTPKEQMNLGGRGVRVDTTGGTPSYQMLSDFGEKYTVDGIPKKKKGGSISSAKARKILEDGTVHGKPLTEKQRRFFGAQLEDGGELPLMSLPLLQSGGSTSGGGSTPPAQAPGRSASGGGFGDFLKGAAPLAGAALGPVGALIGAGIGIYNIFRQRKKDKEAKELAEKRRKEMQHQEHVASLREEFSNTVEPDINYLPTTMQYGGMLLRDLKGQSHAGAQGGIPTDSVGNPSILSKRRPVALTEGDEVVWNGYVFSDDENMTA